ncbi:MAG: GNAT family N-acetyltransferase [Desulfobacter sp.]|nr:GNAT family N-acetyltransferase [Desulfobacter sp.]
MNLSPILFVRRPETKITQGLAPCSQGFFAGIELVCAGLSFSHNADGFFIRRVVDVQGEQEIIKDLKTALDQILLCQVPCFALILLPPNDCWGPVLERMIFEACPGIQMSKKGDHGFVLCSAAKTRPLSGQMPMAVLPVCVWGFKDGHGVLNYIETGVKTILPHAISFLWAVDLKGKSETCMPGKDPGQELEALDAFLAPWLNQKSDSSPFSLEICLFPGMDFTRVKSRLAFWYQKGLRMIHWRLGPHGKELPRALLWQVSKQGVWNHVSGIDLFGSDPEKKTLAAWIGNTPNIVHSFENLSPANGTMSDRFQVPDDLLDYGRLGCLPNIPLWQAVRDPGLILTFLGQMEKKQLAGMRVSPANGALSRLGQNIKFYFKKPGQISPPILDEIVAMVDAGGSVDITHVRANLERAFLIGYGVENGCIVGNSSLKHPRQVFIDRIKGITGLDFTHCVERGYTSVRPEYRAMGIGARLLEGLTKRAKDKKVFSIISEDNLATQKIAERNNTRKITTYFSEKLKKEMGVWMPAHMNPDPTGAEK